MLMAQDKQQAKQEWHNPSKDVVFRRVVMDGSYEGPQYPKHDDLTKGKRHNTLDSLHPSSLEESNTIRRINWKALREASELSTYSMKLLKQTSLNKSLFELYCWATQHAVVDTNDGRKSRTYDVAPYLVIDGHRCTDIEELKHEGGLINAKLKRFTRSRWKTPGELSLLVGKERNKVGGQSVDDPLTLHRLAGEMHRVWRGTNQLGREVTDTVLSKEQQSHHQYSNMGPITSSRRPIRIKVPPPGVIHLANTQTSRAPTVNQDEQSLLQINTVTSKPRLDKRHRNKLSDSQVGKVDLQNHTESGHSAHMEIKLPYINTSMSSYSSSRRKGHFLPKMEEKRVGEGTSKGIKRTELRLTLPNTLGHHAPPSSPTSSSHSEDVDIRMTQQNNDIEVINTVTAVNSPGRPSTPVTPPPRVRRPSLGVVKLPDISEGLSRPVIKIHIRTPKVDHYSDDTEKSENQDIA